MSKNLTLSYNIIVYGGRSLFWLILACTGNKGQGSLLQEDNAIIYFGEQLTCSEGNHSWSKLQDQALERGINLNITPHASREECEYTPGGVVAQDLNGDGSIDLIFSEYMAEPYIFQNDGTGQFSQISLGLGVYDSSRLNLGLAAVDLNGDFLPELIISGAGFVVYAENLGEFHFGEWQIIVDQVEYPRPCYNAFSFGDFDRLRQ